MLGLLGAGTPAIEPAFDPDGNGRIDQALAAHANPDHTLLTYSATGRSLSPTPDPAHRVIAPRRHSVGLRANERAACAG
ncbi:hypothetical protein [Nocardia brasiliensis]|uniref:hypothetical protein n=1 Tax=Nocardia brasiliensis TaxID=37326 RepID=UPI002456FAA6|nr:hypothetical protein [Nocardia brasiliensis]